MSFEDFFKKAGRDMSEKQINIQNEILNKHTQGIGEHPDDQIFFTEHQVTVYEKEKELLQEAKNDLFREIKNAPSISKIIQNPENFIDDNSQNSVEDIQKWIKELDRDIHKIDRKIKELEKIIEKLKILNTSSPELN